MTHQGSSSFGKGLLQSQQHKAQDDAPNDGEADAQRVRQDLIPEDATRIGGLCREETSSKAQGQAFCRSLLNSHGLRIGSAWSDEGARDRQVAQGCQQQHGEDWSLAGHLGEKKLQGQVVGGE